MRTSALTPQLSQSALRRTIVCVAFGASFLLPAAHCQAGDILNTLTRLLPAPRHTELPPGLPPGRVEVVQLSAQITQYIVHPPGQTEQNQGQAPYFNYYRTVVTLGCRQAPVYAPGDSDGSAQAAVAQGAMVAGIRQHACAPHPATMVTADALPRRRINLAQNGTP